jgi:lysozyme family protein
MGREPLQVDSIVNFDQAFDALIGVEGDYSNNSNDPGGETRWGVTRKVAIQEGYTGDMRVFPRETAKDIYQRLYWTPLRADELPDGIRYTVFDGAVNSGVSQAVKWLQAALGVAQDGVIGPATIAAANAAGPLLGAVINAERLQFMTDLPQWAAFGRGWARRIASNLKGLQ